MARNSIKSKPPTRQHRIKPTMSERGFASIIVTTVLIAVIGLIIVGFSLTVRRNQKETLDRQLSTQAYYAAETAVNEAKATAVQQFLADGQVKTKTECDAAEYNTRTYSQDGVNVSCLLVDGSLDSMLFNSVVEGQDTFAAVIPTDPGAAGRIKYIDLTWKPASKPADNPEIGCNGGSGVLPPRNNWGSCDYGALRIDVADGFETGFNPNAFATSAILLPSAGPVNATLNADVNYSFTNAGAYQVGATDCNSTVCAKRITITAPADGKSYYMRMRSIYRDSSVSIYPKNAAGGTVETKGQIIIDATGKAQGVLRRIQVRVPVDAGAVNAPFGAIESTGSICKRFAVAPGYLGGGGANGLCQ